MKILAEEYSFKTNLFKPGCSVFIDRHYFCHVFKSIVRLPQYFGIDFDGDNDACEVVPLVRAFRTEIEFTMLA